MQIITEVRNLIAPWERAIATLGDFDGIHTGHRFLIQKTVEKARKSNTSPILVTYDPSPKKVLQKLSHDSRIYTKNEKILLLKKFELEAVVFLPFDLKMSRMSGKRFLNEILLEKLKIKNFLLGYDHRFGLNRRGSFAYLKSAAQKYSFCVEKISPVTSPNQDLVISSSQIRKFLENGKIEQANKLLQFPYFVTGMVVRGKQIGRQMGFPTANLNVNAEKMLPLAGVYMGSVMIEKKLYRSVVNIGYKPTFNNPHLTIEAHVLNYKGNLYGKTLRVFFLERIRDEKKFNNVLILQEQIRSDIIKAEKMPILETNKNKIMSFI